MARATGTAAVVYGCEVMGIADTQLHAARVQVARAAAPAASGKNPDLTLIAVDGDRGTVDPAFEAHWQPLRHWATAWWEGWFSAKILSLAFLLAWEKLRLCSHSPWQKVAGAASAFIASMERIGWKAHEPRERPGGPMKVRRGPLPS